MPVQRGERADTVARGLEFRARLRLADAAGLQVEQRSDDLEIVLHAVMDLLHQQVLLRQHAAQLRFAFRERAGGLGKGLRQFGELAGSG